MTFSTLSSLCRNIRRTHKRGQALSVTPSKFHFSFYALLLLSLSHIKCGWNFHFSANHISSLFFPSSSSSLCSSLLSLMSTNWSNCSNSIGQISLRPRSRTNFQHRGQKALYPLIDKIYTKLLYYYCYININIKEHHYYYHQSASLIKMSLIA